MRKTRPPNVRLCSLGECLWSAPHPRSRDAMLVHRTVCGSGLCTRPQQGQGEAARVPGTTRAGARRTPGPVRCSVSS